jgi:uncharacterized protein YidB (DUF937 family)
MGFLDGLLKQATGAQTETGQAGGLGDLVGLVGKNPQILNALTSLLSTKDSTVGGTGGLGGLVHAFERQGLGSMISSWISTGPNPTISTEQVTRVLGHDTVNQFAAKSGLPPQQAGSVLAGLLPSVIDQLTPDGKVPEMNALEGNLKSLLAGLGR